MKSFKLLGFLVVTVFLSSIAKGQTISRPLIADRYSQIGTVDVTKFGNYVRVAYYVTNANWTIDRTHLHVAGTKAAIPSDANGNPLVRNFTHQRKHEAEDTVIYDSINVSALTNVFVSANASVRQAVGCEMDVATINASVPSQVYMRLSLTLSPEYFNMLVYDLSGSPIYAGYFAGNCVDLDRPILPGTNYYPYAVSSYSSDTALLSCIIDKPGNLDIVNYIINQPYASTLNATGKEVQAAIWTIIDDDTPVNGAAGLTWNQSIVDAIINDAIAKGEGYVPRCDEFFAVLLDQGCSSNSTPTVQQSIFWLPTNTVPSAQTTIYEQCANAWGSGFKFAGGGWGMYFKF